MKVEFHWTVCPNYFAALELCLVHKIKLELIFITEKMETKVQHSFVGKKIAEKGIQNFFHISRDTTDWRHSRR